MEIRLLAENVADNRVPRTCSIFFEISNDVGSHFSIKMYRPHILLRLVNNYRYILLSQHLLPSIVQLAESSSSGQCTCSTSTGDSSVIVCKYIFFY